MPTDPSEAVLECKFPEWQPQFRDAIVEFDPRKLPSLVEAAANAIILRLKSPQTSPEEVRALANALHSLRTIQAKRLNSRKDARQDRA
jgi:hypothetical protein